MIGIYKITNLINGKCYIGQSINILQRWKQHRTNYQTREEALYLAMRKYGINNFAFEVIEECREEELDSKEKYYIHYYDSYNNGYNLTHGGQFKKDFYSLKIYQLWEEGKSVSQITNILKLNRQTVLYYLQSYKNYSIKESNVRGGKQSYKTMQKNNTLPEHMQPKRIIQYDIWGNKIKEWSSAKEINRNLGIDTSLIGKVIKGEYLQAGGYQFHYYGDNEIKDISQQINLKFGIIQKNLNNNILNKFPSIKSAAFSLNKKPSQATSISKCCLGKQKTAYGYKWEYDYSIWNEKSYQKGADTNVQKKDV